MAVVEGMLERITFVAEETGYTIARLATERSGADLLTVVGSLLGVQVGESLRLVGRWGSHPRYGRQFQVHSFTTVLPATIQGVRRYLGSGMIKGIGPMMAERMVDHFGLDILRIIEEEPARLVEVRGLGPKRTKRIAQAWEEQKAIKEVMVFLQGQGCDKVVIGVSAGVAGLVAAGGAVRAGPGTGRTRRPGDDRGSYTVIVQEWGRVRAFSVAYPCSRWPTGPAGGQGSRAALWSARRVGRAGARPPSVPWAPLRPGVGAGAVVRRCSGWSADLRRGLGMGGRPARGSTARLRAAPWGAVRADDPAPGRAR